MIVAKCNYHIYNKELLVIICLFEFVQSELEYTKLLIQILTNYQALKIFMKNKELIRIPATYLKIFSEINFLVIFEPGKQNSKADSITYT